MANRFAMMVASGTRFAHIGVSHQRFSIVTPETWCSFRTCEKSLQQHFRNGKNLVIRPAGRIAPERSRDVGIVDLDNNTRVKQVLITHRKRKKLGLRPIHTGAKRND